MSAYFIQCLHWWKFQWFIRSKFIKFCNHRCKSIRSHIRVLFNPIMISVAYIKLPTSTSIVAGNFFLCFVYKDLRSIRSNILCIFYCITISRNTTPNTLDLLMPHKTPTVSCDLQSCNRHATIQRFIVTACSDTEFIGPHGRSGSW